MFKLILLHNLTEGLQNKYKKISSPLEKLFLKNQKNKHLMSFQPQVFACCLGHSVTGSFQLELLSTGIISVSEKLCA